MKNRKALPEGTAILEAPATENDERLISISYVLRDTGVTAMTIWRWSRHSNPALRFPPPDLVLSSKKRLWRLGRYQAWKDRVLARGSIDTPRKGHAAEELTSTA